MAMSALSTRLKRLERTTHRVCPDCGHGGPMTFAPLSDDDDHVPTAPPKPCRTCGWTVPVFPALTFDDRTAERVAAIIQGAT